MTLVLRKRVIPQSTPYCFIIEPKGRTFANGLARQYSNYYDKKSTILREHISKDQFEMMVD